MKLIKRLRQLLDAANSKTGLQVEQWEMSRTSVKSVELTVETHEVFLGRQGTEVQRSRGPAGQSEIAAAGQNKTPAKTESEP